MTRLMTIKKYFSKAVINSKIIFSLDFGVDVEPDIRHHSSFSTPQVPVSSVYATSVISGEQHG
jgi:hypothetical protein